MTEEPAAQERTAASLDTLVTFFVRIPVILALMAVAVVLVAVLIAVFNAPSKAEVCGGDPLSPGYTHNTEYCGY